ncbi:MAG: HRDC domain-containing protein [Acidobacteriota bacterium]
MKISYRYLIDPDETREALSVFGIQEVIGLDTETFWDSTTRKNHLSLLQVAAQSGEVLVIDALAAGIMEARGLIENPEILMVAHNAKFDEGSLKSEGFTPHGLVDTLRLSRRSLPLKSFSLASVTAHLYGIELDKTYQRSDWSCRPLSRAQLDYAAHDAQIVLKVYHALSDMLKAEGRWERELERARLDVKPKRVPKHAREAASLIDRPWTPEERKLLDRLQCWRKQAARNLGLPAYFVCPERTLEHLVVSRPEDLDGLSQIFGLGPAKVASFGPALLAELLGQK